MVDQREIHRKARSDKAEDRRDAADQFYTCFAELPDKPAAWSDLHRLTNDEDSSVRWRAVEALDVAFPHVPDKPAAWSDLIRLTSDEDRSVRSGAVHALYIAFPHVPNKPAAWSDLQRLANDEDIDVQLRVLHVLYIFFPHVPDKPVAWEDLHRLTSDEDVYVRSGAAGAFGVAFPYVPDKAAAWEDLHRLTSDEDSKVRVWTAGALCLAFPYIPNKAAAWEDLHRLTNDEDDRVRCEVAGALGVAFPYVPDKAAAWDDLHRLTSDEYSSVRWGAAGVISVAFSHVPDKAAAWDDLHRLTSDEYSSVRRKTAEALGAVSPYVLDKNVAWRDLLGLAKDSDSNVRVSANHSLGQLSILKAIEAESEESLREELENALEFFERSAAGPHFSDHPISFCHPFYRSFYCLTFKREDAEAEVQRYLYEAKRASKGSKSKEDLLEAVENLANALREAQDLREKSLEAVKRDLNAYRRYCDRVTELLDDTGETAPGATAVIRRGLPVIDHRIKETITEIQEMARELCKLTIGTPVEPKGAEFYRDAGDLSGENDLKCGRSIFRMAELLEDMCEFISPNRKEQARDLIKEIYNYTTLGDQINRLETAMSYIQPNVDIDRYCRQFEDIKSELGEIKRNTVNISRNLVDLQEKILNRLDQNEKTIIAAIIDQSDQDQLQELLDLVKQVLSKLQNQEIALRGSLTPGDVDQLSKMVNDIKLDTTDRLTVTMPIIPYVLKYEHEIALGKGVNLSAVWKQLVSRTWRRR